MIRIALLAVIAFTLVMTVLAVVEPLRKEGLDPKQVVALFGYTLPVMLSLTLPIAALFASTMVYGRLSQDNELLACRASGINTVRLLIPAFVLGAIVTVVSLILSFVVSPHMAALGTKAAKASIRQIVYHKLQAESNFDYDRFTVHADQVDVKRDTLHGPVVTETKEDGRTFVYAASSAVTKFMTDETGQKYVVLHLEEPARIEAGARQLPQQQSLTVSVPVPDVLKERPSWYTWSKLVGTLRNPLRNAEMRRTLSGIRRLIAYDRLAGQAIETVRKGEAFGRLRYENDKHEAHHYFLRAGKAVRAGPGEAVFGPVAGLPRPDEIELASWPVTARLARHSLLDVELVEVVDGSACRIVTCGQARIRPSKSTQVVRRGAAESLLAESGVHLQLSDNVVVTYYGTHETEQFSREVWDAPRMPLIPEIQQSGEKLGLKQIYDRPQDYTENKSIHKLVAYVKSHLVPRLTSHVLSELHGRVAYCLSCFLLVSMGAALGVVFRGGQLISAFTLSVIPSAFVIVMIVMGKQLIRNPHVPAYQGVLAIWSGLGVLLVANIVIYARLARR